MRRRKMIDRTAIIGGAGVVFGAFGLLLVTDATSEGGVFAGWLLLALGAMAVQAAIVGWVMLAGIGND